MLDTVIFCIVLEHLKEMSEICCHVKSVLKCNLSLQTTVVRVLSVLQSIARRLFFHKLVSGQSVPSLN